MRSGIHIYMSLKLLINKKKKRKIQDKKQRETYEEKKFVIFKCYINKEINLREIFRSKNKFQLND